MNASSQGCRWPGFCAQDHCLKLLSQEQQGEQERGSVQSDTQGKANKSSACVFVHGSRDVMNMANAAALDVHKYTC